MSRRFFAVSCVAAIVAAAPQMAQSQVPVAPPTGLRCEYLTNPVGIDVERPRFSWQLDSGGRRQGQSGYQILVSSKADAGAGEVWDSSRVASGQMTNIAYAGSALKSGQTYYWKVRSWDKDGNAGPYSAAAKFEMGLLAASDWKGRWISGQNAFRKEFRLEGRPARARAYIAGVGYYELRLNGRKVGNHVLDPGWTTYDKRVLYAAYDVTSFLTEGQNAVSVLLGQGWYGSRALMFQMNIQLEGGREVQVSSDASWKSHQSPITADSVYDGEAYDARLEMPGWDRLAFDDSGWRTAALADGPKGILSAQMMPPIRVIDTIVPVKITSPKAGVYVFDLGQNISGWVRLRVRGPRGTAVTMRHAELLYDDGTLNVENLRKAKATDTYILRGEGEEVYEPRFTYHGFRYVELSGYPGAPGLDTVRGRVVHTAADQIGGFACSKPVLNQIQKNVLWGVKTNLHSIPTDCDQRDERMGWMADAHLAAEAAMANFDMAAFYTNFLRDIRDAQGPDGSVTDTVPFKWGSRPADPAWGGAYPLIAWYMYQNYGDRRILEEHYGGIKAWADYLRSRSDNSLLGYSYYGDWVAVDKAPGALVSTFYYYYTTSLLSKMAAILNKPEDAEVYGRQAAEIKSAFHRKFFNADANAYGNGSQGANTLALALDLVPNEVKQAVIASLENDIIYARNTHLTTGILSTKYLLPLLTRVNRSDLAYELATQTTYPSWGYMIESGATTLWELWQNKTGPSMNSHNHAMFGSIGAWFYQALAGINTDPAAPGFERIRIEPQIVRDLEWASGSMQTLRGTVSSSWKRSPDSLHLEVVIPAGSAAEIHVPKLGIAEPVVREGGKVVWAERKYQAGTDGVQAARETDDDVIFETGSGSYAFEASVR